MSEGTATASFGAGVLLSRSRGGDDGIIHSIAGVVYLSLGMFMVIISGSML